MSFHGLGHFPLQISCFSSKTCQCVAADGHGLHEGAEHRCVDSHQQLGASDGVRLDASTSTTATTKRVSKCSCEDLQRSYNLFYCFRMCGRKHIVPPKHRTCFLAPRSAVLPGEICSVLENENKIRRKTRSCVGAPMV